MRAQLSMLPRRFLSSRPRCERLDFSDHSVAYRHKSLWELVRALGVLKACSYDAFVDNSHWVSDGLLAKDMDAVVNFHISRKILGHEPWSSDMREGFLQMSLHTRIVRITSYLAMIGNLLA